MRAIRVVLAVLAVLAVAIVGLVKVRLLSPPAHAQALPPNVVVIMVDDLDVGSLEAAVAAGFMNNFSTFLSATGKTFSNAFVSYSLCCPSRATFLTGQYAHNHGVKNNNGDDGGCAAFDDDSTIATWLELPYHTGFVGKYLNGYGTGDESDPPPYQCSHPRFEAEGWDDWQALVGESKMLGYQINNNGELEGPFPNVYQTTKLAEKAAAFIEFAPEGTPFFLWVTPFAPHIEPAQELCANNLFPNAATIRSPSPYDDDAELLTLPQGVSFNEADVSDKPEPIKSEIDALNEQTWGHITCTQNVWQDRLESLILVDQLIGTIATALVNKEVDENTVVVFTSDNGYYHGEHRLQTKVFPYEEGIRVPLVIRYPTSLDPQPFDEFVVNTDLAPTIAELAGVSPPPGFVDGRSIVEMLQGQQPNPTTWRKRFLIEHWTGPATHRIPTFFGIRTAPTDTTLLTANALYMEYHYSSPTSTDYEYYEQLHQAPGKYQMDNLYYDPEVVVDPDFPLRLSALKTCSGSTPNTTPCQTLEN